LFENEHDNDQDDLDISDKHMKGGNKSSTVQLLSNEINKDNNKSDSSLYMSNQDDMPALIPAGNLIASVLNSVKDNKIIGND
jgi:hypothetical protein